MLQLLKESVSSRHAERLEQIVIVLIAIEIGAWARSNLVNYRELTITIAFSSVLGIVTILVDLFA
jgi:hypothetical protein